MEPNYRRCISCRKVAHKSNFIRVVRTFPTGKIELNEGMGRSAYLCPTPDCLTQAQKKKQIQRALRVNIVDMQLYKALWTLVTTDSLGSVQQFSHERRIIDNAR
jgi:hypothetical protein